jgi:hypothetical protein
LIQKMKVTSKGVRRRKEQKINFLSLVEKRRRRVFGRGQRGASERAQTSKNPLAASDLCEIKIDGGAAQD